MTNVAGPFDVVLTACRPEPLAGYLKALGILRLVAEQRDADARGFWRGEHFVLRSQLSRDALVDFLIRDWSPTPVLAPWNGGSGFYPKDNAEAAEAILQSNDARLRVFAQSIRIAREFVGSRGWSERPADENKAALIAAMRALLPDAALAWLDAAVVLGDDRLLFPPLLGTGGNDGRLDFSNNFQQRVAEVIDSPSRSDLENALFGTLTTHRYKGTMGQFQPAAKARTNPWDFVLLIEGALFFAGAATRRFEGAPVTMAFPFHARSAGGLATVTDSDEDESRDELWLPLWSAPATEREVRHLFSEGRATVGTGLSARPASSALDFARAVTSLGMDRGIDSFVRVGFHVRNGLAYFATPLGRFSTREVHGARLLDEIDGWYDLFRWKSSSKSAPASVRMARRRLETAMFEAAGRDAMSPVLIELGQCEQTLAQSLSFAKDAFLRPIPILSSAWQRAVAARSVEHRLGACLAARRDMRRRLVPLDAAGRQFADVATERVFASRPLIDNLHALLLREDIEESQGTPLPPPLAERERCSLSDIALFIDGLVDDDLVEQWLRAAVLVEGGLLPDVPHEQILPPVAFSLLAVVHSRKLASERIPRTSGALARACAGDSLTASASAVRRINAHARPLPFRSLVEPRIRRVAAALAFPLTQRQRSRLERMLLIEADSGPSTDQVLSLETV